MTREHMTLILQSGHKEISKNYSILFCFDIQQTTKQNMELNTSITNWRLILYITPIIFL